MGQPDDLLSLVKQMAELIQKQNEYLGRLHARLVVLRKHIAALHQNPDVAEAEIQKQEENAQAIVLSGSGYPESDAVFQLMKAGKKLGDTDA
jgi:hypothetical protein